MLLGAICGWVYGCSLCLPWLMFGLVGACLVLRFSCGLQWFSGSWVSHEFLVFGLVVLRFVCVYCVGLVVLRFCGCGLCLGGLWGF